MKHLIYTELVTDDKVKSLLKTLGRLLK